MLIKSQREGHYTEHQWSPWNVSRGFECLWRHIPCHRCSWWMPKSGAVSGTFIGILDKIIGWKEESLHILITSRRETDIRDSLSNYASELQNYFSIIVEEDSLDLDIQAFLRSSLNSRSFSRWNEELKTEAISTLLGRTQGMYEHSTSLLYLSLTWPRFRLMALQLAELKRVSMTSAAKIRQVIQNLPSTLDAFSERSLLYIDSFQSEQAHTLLQWITFSPQPLTH